MGWLDYHEPGAALPTFWVVTTSTMSKDLKILARDPAMPCEVLCISSLFHVYSPLFPACRDLSFCDVICLLHKPSPKASAACSWTTVKQDLCPTQVSI